MDLRHPRLLPRKHIQDHNEANTTEKHYFGYSSRVLPCRKDKGTCEYLDAIYHMQELHILYSWIFWAVLLAILVAWAMVRALRTTRRAGVARESLLDVVCERVGYAKRRWGIADVWRRWEGVSRLQALTLALLLAYLLIFTFVGIVYRIWITPIKGSNLHNTRTGGLGGLSDRLGVLAFALTPFAILLCMRESLLSQVTGIPYQYLNFLHRWTGRVIFLQSAVHTLGWTVVEGRLYQPQPLMYKELMEEQYIIFGVVAMFLLSLMLVLSADVVVERTGYGWFKVGHWSLAVLYLGACWGHWEKLWCWIMPALVLVAVDQVLQWGRSAYLHFRPSAAGGFRCAEAKISVFSSSDEGEVVRLDFLHPFPASQLWQAGQHFLLTFPALSIWNSHPLTPASLPQPGKQQQHTYILRVRSASGQVAKLAALGHGSTTPVIMCGPYGSPFPRVGGGRNLLAVAGGTGVSFALPVVLRILKWRGLGGEKGVKGDGLVDFVWIVKKAECLLWLEEGIRTLRDAVEECVGLRIKIFVTREDGSSADAEASDEISKQAEISITPSGDCNKPLAGILTTSSPRYSVTFLNNQHPSTREIVADFIARVDELKCGGGGGGGGTEILGSGPEGLGSDLRAAVAGVRGHPGLGFYWDARG
ncbi:ferric reductase FRE2 precursor [Teratosphaeria destructans]|uniref:Ferric reductase FRE2 n=1 Tax=Teratosphaeria destructans TaxID=418781 RepID=A0A9W7SKT4_9PEZI|nr:ferric reductase FRE2 precursor [Teratosphaeria destructans]